MKVALSIQNCALGSYCLAFLTQANHWRAFKCPIAQNGPIAKDQSNVY